MQFYRMFCLDDELAELHATLIYLPFRYGFSLKRWQQSVHYMLMKIEVPLWEKLRIIQLLEGDINGGLRFLFGRKLMHSSVIHKTSSDDTYGGRPGRSCHDALLRIQLSMEYCRLARRLAAFMDIDATACFDNQVRNLIGIANRKLGADANMTRCQTDTLQKMEHKTRIHQGISKTSISHSEHTPIYGSSQGSGAGVINWHGHNEILIAMYNETQPGCKMMSLDSRHTQMQRVISFVDDNKLVRDFPPQTPVPKAFEGCTTSINSWRRNLELTGGALAPPKCNIQMLTIDFNTYLYAKHYPYRGQPIYQRAHEQQGQCKLWDNDAKKYHNVQKLDPTVGRKLLGVRLAMDGNCNDEFKARKEQSEKMAARLAASNATPVDAYMIYMFRFCPAVFYCIPITYFTKAQCDTIQSPFMNVLLPKLRINRHVKRAVVWGNVKYGGLALKHMATEQTAKLVECLIGHVRANSPTGKTFTIACETYQMLLGIMDPFLMTDPTDYPHRISARTSKITFLWEELRQIDSFIMLRNMWTPEPKQTPCIMDAVIQARNNHRGTVKYISDETVRLVNACRLWTRALYVEDLFDEENRVDSAYLTGNKQCNTTLNFPHQPRPPDWVWRIWRQTLCKVFLQRRDESDSWYYYGLQIKSQKKMQIDYLPKHIRPELTLRQIVEELPASYQQVLGEVDYPDDDGKTLAEAIRNGQATIYSDGTVDDGCATHAYTVRTEDDNKASAVSGAAPTCGDPLTVSSLRPEHCGALAGLLWIWIIVNKYTVTEGQVLEGASDNLTVVHRLNDGIDEEAGHQKHLATDYDVWTETDTLLKTLPIQCNFRHVKGHQDDMYKAGKEGPLPRDAFWNVQMDAKAGEARPEEPMETANVFGTSTAVFVHKGRPIYTKIAQTIQNELLDPPLRKYIQDKEQWDDSTFEAVDWTALETALKKVTVHKRINIAKHMFNWQNTGYQKQQFENGVALTEQRDAQTVNVCPMGCGEVEIPQHYLQCKILHDAKIIHRDFAAVSSWMKKNKTQPELRIILEKSLTHWMETGEPLEMWELQESKYRERLEDAILNQNFIGWGNMMKGRIAREWGEIQMTYYEEIYDNEIPSHISATWWASKFIRQILFFSLATWQHQNNYLHKSEEDDRKFSERMEAVEQMAQWYEKKDDFTKEDKLNFSRSFLERCTDTTAQIRLWLGKIVDIHKYNLRNTLHGYFPRKM